ncbi:MAG: hypothetical protein C4341_10225, partial [Armatimonadota bacterium]
NLAPRGSQYDFIDGFARQLRDAVPHFERRLEALDGKAIVVCMSRRICADLYREITRPHPEWHHDEDALGQIKVVMTGSPSDLLVHMGVAIGRALEVSL